MPAWRLRRSRRYREVWSKEGATLSRALNIALREEKEFSSSSRIHYQSSRGGVLLDTFIPLSYIDQGNNITASSILRRYRLTVWPSASIQWAIAVFASIICSYPDSAVGQPRRRVSLGINQRDTSSGGARQTLICEIHHRDGSTSRSRESSETPPSPRRCH